MEISSFVHGFAAGVTVMGDPRFWFILELLLLVPLMIFSKARKKTIMDMAEFILLKAIPVMILAFGSAIALQYLIKIPRPCQGAFVCPSGFSFPSAHATVAFAVFIAFGLSGKKISKKKFVLSLVPAVLVAWSRIELGVHEPIDVVGGAVLGTLVGIAYIALWQNIFVGHTTTRSRLRTKYKTR